MDDLSASVVIFHGKKFFWRTGNTVDVTIVEHLSLDVTEVICYDSSIDKESPRIFLNSAILSVKIDRNDIAEKLNFVNGVVHRATADFILNRLSMQTLSVDTKEFVVKMKLYFCDHDLEADGDCDGVDALLCEKPAGLRCYPVRHKLLEAGEVDAVFSTFEEGNRSLRAEEPQVQSQDPLGVKERWRIPIVLAKVGSDHRLTEADDKIWSSVAQNVSIQDEASPFAGVALRIDSSSPTSAAKYTHSGRIGTMPNTPTRSRSGSPRVGLTPHNSQRLAAGRVRAPLGGSPRVSRSPSSRHKRLKGALSSEILAEDKEFVPLDSSVGRSDDTKRAHTTLLGHIVSGLSTLTSSFSSKFKSINLSSSSGEFSERTPDRVQFTPLNSNQRGADASLSISTEDFSAPRHAFAPLGSGSSSPSFRSEQNSVRLQDCRPTLTSEHSLLRLDTGLNLSADDAEAPPRTAAVPQPPPVSASPGILRSYLSAKLPASNFSSDASLLDSPSQLALRKHPSSSYGVSMARGGRMYARAQDQVVPFVSEECDIPFNTPHSNNSREKYTCDVCGSLHDEVPC